MLEALSEWIAREVVRILGWSKETRRYGEEVEMDQAAFASPVHGCHGTLILISVALPWRLVENSEHGVASATTVVLVLHSASLMRSSDISLYDLEGD